MLCMFDAIHGFSGFPYAVAEYSARLGYCGFLLNKEYVNMGSCPYVRQWLFQMGISSMRGTQRCVSEKNL